MALIQCRECGKQISDSATACPHCGAPFIVGAQHATRVEVVRKPGGCAMVFGALAIIFVGILIIGSLAKESPPDVPQVSQATPLNPASVEKHWVVMGRQGRGVVFIAIDETHASDMDEYRRAASAECNPQWCQALFWKSLDATAVALPLTERQVLTQTASYSLNPARNVSRWLWRCDAFEGVPESNCFTPEP